MNKRAELEAAVVQFAPDIICVTEFAPKNCSVSIQESELQLDGFDLFCNCSAFKRGVIIYVKSVLSPTPSSVSDVCSFEENCWCEISLRGNDRLLIGCIYRSPNSNTSNNENMIKDLVNICQKPYSHVLLCGDFNYPGINWGNNEECDSHNARFFLDCVRDCFLHQHVTEPTHHRPNQQANILDLLLTSEEGMIDQLEHSAPIGKSHHSVLIFNLNCYKPPPEFKPRYLYERADIMLMSETIEKFEWEQDLCDLICEEAWTIFCERYQKAQEKYVPKSRPSTKKQKPPWMNQEMLTKLKEKQKAFKKYMETKDGDDYRIYSRSRNQAKWQCRKAARDYERNIAKEAKSNPKRFYNYSKKKMKTKSGIADLTEKDGFTASNNREKAVVLNDFFSSVFTREDMQSMPELPKEAFRTKLADLTITPKQVEKRLAALKPNKATGPDGFPPRMLKELAGPLSKPLSIIMNKSLQEGRLPKIWKTAHVVPIFKKGKKNIAGNYRPVSLTSVICKVMESIVREKLLEHLKHNNLITTSQHGFVGGRSCSTNLLAALDSWTEILDSGGGVDTAYLDFAKAFDTVPHERLLHKLRGLGVVGKPLKWIRDFLSERTQKVVIEGEESGWKDVVSGIPQGSVLGPLLFVCFVNDLPDAVTSKVYLFADDTKLIAKVPQDKAVLQQDLELLQNWSNKWQLKFNATKCKIMHMGKQSEPADYTMSSEGNTVTLEVTRLEKDLGVNIDSELNFDEHVAIQTKKASQILGIIRRTFTHLDRESVPLLYKSLVRPHLEYCNVVWQPKWKKDKDLLEEIQRRATKMIPDLKDKSYVERLKALKLPSLYYRRARGDMIECFKYLSGIYEVNTDFLVLADSGYTRGHSRKLKKLSSKKSCRSNFFSRRIVNAWNSLPDSVVAAPSLNTFKSSLDKHWLKFQYHLDSDWFDNPTIFMKMTV